MKCPNCGDNLIFDPEKQLFTCKSCDSVFKAKQKISAQKAEEHEDTGDSFKVTKFTCSSCSALLTGTYENSALGFCPYCGSESILSSRLTAKRPAQIVPFSKTKAQCQEQYLNMINKLPLVPSALKQKEHIDEIRGIYVPYYIYHVKHQGNIDAEYDVSHGNTTDYYSLKGNVDATIMVPVDGSAQLDDNIGEIVFTYDKKSAIPFDEKYLTTYYAELPDAKDAGYIDRVKKQAVFQEMKSLQVYSKGNACTNENPQVDAQIKVTGKHILLSPTYFLTYKNKDRVCYTVIPGTGQNDKSYAEVPVDTVKYLLCTVALAALIWAGLSFIPFIPTFKHEVTLGIMDLLASFAMLLQGLSYNKQKARYEGLGKQTQITVKSSKASVLKYVVLAFILFPAGTSALISGSFDIIAIIIAAFQMHHVSKIHKQYPQINTRPSVFMFVFIVIMTLTTWFAKTVFLPDRIMYPLMTLVTIPVVLCFLSLIRTFNEACTRPLPHFTRKGGHNRAKDL